ncbi:MASE3 domain-containing protein [Thermodesulfobacteriota bacterium]
MVNSKKLIHILIFAFLFLFFIETAHHNYLLFHSTVELFSIFVAFGIFVIAWNSHKLIDNNYILILGIAYLFIGVLDLLHTFSYKGLGIFPSYSANLPTQLWIASRYIESITLLIAPFFIGKSLRIPLLCCVYASITFLFIGAIFVWDIFPACYIDGFGLTPFKRYSEYLISAFLFAAIIGLLKKKEEFEPYIIKLIVASLVFSIISELAFTFYISVYGFSNFIGHLFKLLSVYFIYLALIKTGLQEPYNLLYRNLKHSEKRFRLLAETSPIGICLSDENKKCQYVNNTWTKMTGIKVADAIGMPCEQGVHPEDRNHLLASFQNMSLSNERESIEYRFQTPDGQVTWVYGFMATMKNEVGEIQGYMRTVTDITDRKKAEEELLALSAKIKKFSYSITHDLKNPVSVISWISDSLNQRYRHLLDDRGKEFCDIIISSSKQLFTLIEKINTYVSSGENQLHLEKFKLIEILSSLEDEFKPRLTEKQVKFSIYRGTKEIKADKLAIMRALRNLVENACNYGGSKLAEIKIKYRDDKNHHLLSVSDDGVGIDSKNDKDIFKEFIRSPTSAGTQGSGLGLAIVQEVASRHGGKAWLENNDNKWTTFYLAIAKQL